MPEPHPPEIGSTIAVEKPQLNELLARLKSRGYQTIGPRVTEDNLVYASIDSLDDLPYGYITDQRPGYFRLHAAGHSHYFDAIPGAQSWKQFLFPPRRDLLKLRRSDGHWDVVPPEVQPVSYALIGVRACELAAIQIQDRIFIRPDFSDPTYHSLRSRLFILAVNCLHPASTCFCSSLGTGPGVRDGFDLALTELEDVFLLTIGSELGRDLLAGLTYESASAFLLNSAQHSLEQAALGMVRRLETQDLPDLILNQLDSSYWREVGARCLGCGNCTQVCPTCFCWDSVESMNLEGTETKRERVWDSCFNPGYSYLAGGNTRPSIASRYRQWLSHKLATWKQQYGTLGCVGCGRCITWCPAAIDLTQEVETLHKEAR